MKHQFYLFLPFADVVSKGINLSLLGLLHVNSIEKITVLLHSMQNVLD